MRSWTRYAVAVSTLAAIRERDEYRHTREVVDFVRTLPNAHAETAADVITHMGRLYRTSYTAATGEANPRAFRHGDVIRVVGLDRRRRPSGGYVA